VAGLTSRTPFVYSAVTRSSSTILREAKAESEAAVVRPGLAAPLAVMFGRDAEHPPVLREIDGSNHSSSTLNTNSPSFSYNSSSLSARRTRPGGHSAIDETVPCVRVEPRADTSREDISVL